MTPKVSEGGRRECDLETMHGGERHSYHICKKSSLCVRRKPSKQACTWLLSQSKKLASIRILSIWLWEPKICSNQKSVRIFSSQGSTYINTAT